MTSHNFQVDKSDVLRDTCVRCGQTQNARVHELRGVTGVEGSDHEPPDVARGAPGGHTATEQSTNPKDLIGRTKVPLEKVPPVSIIWEAIALGEGGIKYGPYNWRDEKVSVMVYIGAARRHLLEYLDGETYDPESYDIHHLALAKACLGIILDAENGGHLVDDRPPKGGAADLIRKLNKEIRDGRLLVPKSAREPTE